MEDDMLTIVELTRETAQIIENFPNLKEKEKEEEDGLLIINKARTKRDLKVMELARKRAKTSNRENEYNKVLQETDWEVFLREALVFKNTITVDPRVEATERVVVKEEDGEMVCGVCQDEFDVGEEASVPACMHKFHGVCLWKWLSDRKTCPLCRFSIL